QVKHVYGPALTDSIDAADSLLEPHRIPRQLEVDDDTADVVQVQPFAGGVGGEKDTTSSSRKRVERCRSIRARQAAMKNGGGLRNGSSDVRERVAVLGKHDQRLVDSFEQPP